MEKESINGFRSLLEPWQVYPPEDDIGIDLEVWPYVGEGQNEPSEMRFLVQMKSTRKHKLGTKKGVCMSFETEHLIGWKRQKDNVLVVLNDLNKKIFHHFWVDEVEFNGKLSSNTVYFSDSCTYEERIRLKSDILAKLYPPEIVSKRTKINPNGSITYTGESKVMHGNSNKYPHMLMELAEEMKKEIAIDESIGEINDMLLDDPKNTDLMFNLAFCYLEKKDFTQTLFVLKRVLKHGIYRSKLLAKVLMKIINDHNNELLDNPRSLTFGHYIQFNTNLK
jgi:hypothetical protein